MFYVSLQYDDEIDLIGLMLDCCFSL